MLCRFLVWAASSWLFLEIINSLLVDRTELQQTICLRYLGIDRGIWDGEISRSGLAHLSESSDIISYQESRKRIADSDLLLYLDWSDDIIRGILGYKLWDYFSTGLPILSISQGDVSPEVKSLLCPQDLQITKSSESLEVCVNYIEGLLDDSQQAISRPIVEKNHDEAASFWSDPQAF